MGAVPDWARDAVGYEGRRVGVTAAPISVDPSEFDELSPIEHSKRLVASVKGPKRMVVYQESRHSVGNVPAANLGPFPGILIADWLATAGGGG